MSVLDLLTEGIRVSAIQALSGLSDVAVKTLFETGIQKISAKGKLTLTQQQRLLRLLGEAVATQTVAVGGEPMAEPVGVKAKCPNCGEQHDVRIGVGSDSGLNRHFVQCPVNGKKYLVNKQV